MPCDFYKALDASVEVGCCTIGRLIDGAAKSLLENWGPLLTRNLVGGRGAKMETLKRAQGPSALLQVSNEGVPQGPPSSASLSQRSGKTSWVPARCPRALTQDLGLGKVRLLGWVYWYYLHLQILDQLH